MPLSSNSQYFSRTPIKTCCQVTLLQMLAVRIKICQSKLFSAAMIDEKGVISLLN